MIRKTSKQTTNQMTNKLQIVLFKTLDECSLHRERVITNWKTEFWLNDKLCYPRLDTSRPSIMIFKTGCYLIVARKTIVTWDLKSNIINRGLLLCTNPGPWRRLIIVIMTMILLLKWMKLLGLALKIKVYTWGKTHSVSYSFKLLRK